MAWSAVALFNIRRRQQGSFENRYYGPYDKLLNYCFGNSFSYHVAPQSPPRDESCETVNFIVYILVLNQDLQPVLIVEVKDDSWVGKPDFCLRADEQMRGRYDSILYDCPLPRLRGLSCLGTAVRVYTGDTETGEVHPPLVPRPSPSNRVLPRDFLEGGWGLDILSQEGFAKMKEIVTDIMQSNAQ